MFSHWFVSKGERWASIFGRSYGRISLQTPPPFGASHASVPHSAQSGQLAALPNVGHQSAAATRRCPFVMKDYYPRVSFGDGAGRCSLRRERKLLVLMVLFATTFWLLRCALLTWRRQQVSPVPEADNVFGPLKFRADGTFQISIFEDLHFGESTYKSNPESVSEGRLLMLSPQTRGTPGARSRTSTQSR